MGVLCADAACAEMVVEAGLVRRGGALMLRCAVRSFATLATSWSRLPAALPTERCASCRAQVDALRLLMLADMEDAGSVLATTTAAARLLAQPPTRDALLGHAELAARFAELLQHPDRGVGEGFMQGLPRC